MVLFPVGCVVKDRPEFFPGSHLVGYIVWLLGLVSALALSAEIRRAENEKDK
jgi:hypothetical protein